MSKRKDTKHPDFLGLQLLDDEIGAGARIAKNCNLDKVAQLDKRGGYRRLNQIRYDGGISAIIDVQRICDYQKILICSGIEFGDPEVFEHEGDVAGGSGAAGFFNPNLLPVAIATGAPLIGLPPLAVQFSSAGSFDPEGGALLYFWNFGDGSPINNEANPLHVYNGTQLRTATLTVRDVSGAEDSDTVQVDTRDVIVASTFAAASYSADGAATFVPTIGVPPGGNRYILGANGFIFQFRVNGVNIECYRSEDGLNYVLVGTFAGGLLGNGLPFIGHDGRILCPLTTAAPAAGIAYSDDNGVTWVVVVVGALGGGGPAARGSIPGEIMYMRQNPLGAGFPYEFFLSVNNGAAWALTAGSFGTSGAGPALVGANAGRFIAYGSAPLGEIRTSDDQSLTWQLRQVTAAATPLGIWADGDDAIVEDFLAVNPPWRSVTNGTAWANFIGWGAVMMRQMINRADGYFAATTNGVYFSAALPNFALRGGGGTGWISIATLRDQET